MNIRKLFAAVGAAVRSFRTELTQPENPQLKVAFTEPAQVLPVSNDDLKKIVTPIVAGQMVNAGFTPPNIDVDGDGEAPVMLPAPVEDFEGELYDVPVNAVITHATNIPTFAECANLMRERLAEQITDNPETDVKRYGLDDLDMFEAAFIMEEEFAVRGFRVMFPDLDVDSAKTLGALYDKLVDMAKNGPVFVPANKVEDSVVPNVNIPPEGLFMEDLTEAVAAAGVDPIVWPVLTTNDRVAAYLKGRPGMVATLKQVQSTLRRHGNFTADELYVMLRDDSEARFDLGERDSVPLSKVEVWLDNQ